MAEASLGIKRACPSCAVKFYDFNSETLTCPKCSHSFAIAAPVKRKPKPVKKKIIRKPKPKKEDGEMPVGVEDLEDLDELDDVPDVPHLEEVEEHEEPGHNEDDAEDDMYIDEIKPENDELLIDSLDEDEEDEEEDESAA